MTILSSTAIVRRWLSSISRSPTTHPMKEAAFSQSIIHVEGEVQVSLTSAVPPNKDRICVFVSARRADISDRYFSVWALYGDAFVGHVVLRRCDIVSRSVFQSQSEDNSRSGRRSL